MIVSARALNIREPTFASLAQCGMSPQRYAVTARRSLALDDHDRLIRRGDVEPLPGIVDERLRPEDLGEVGRGTLLGEPTAHRPSLASPPANGRRPSPAASVRPLLYSPGDD